MDPAWVLPQIHGRRSIDSIRRVAPHLDAESEDAWLRRRESEDTEGVFALPGAREFLLSLTKPWTIVTSGTSEVARARIRAAGLPEPPFAVFGEDVTEGKPHPAPFLLGASKLGVSPSRCVAFEDTPAGIQSAGSAGMSVIALSFTYPVSELAAADAVVSSFLKIFLKQDLLVVG